jgi:hypothetical protein
MITSGTFARMLVSSGIDAAAAMARSTTAVALRATSGQALLALGLLRLRLER